MEGVFNPLRFKRRDCSGSGVVVELDAEAGIIPDLVFEKARGGTCVFGGAFKHVEGREGLCEVLIGMYVGEKRTMYLGEELRRFLDGRVWTIVRRGGSRG